VQFIRNKDRLFPEGRNVEKFGGVSRLLKNAAAADDDASFFEFFYLFFLLFLRIQAKCGGSHGQTPLQLLNYTVCSESNVRFYCLGRKTIR